MQHSVPRVYRGHWGRRIDRAGHDQHSHRVKIGRMAWATEDERRYLAMPEEEYIEVQEPTFGNRMGSMYVGLKDDKVLSPANIIGEEDARNIIHTTEVAFQRIIEATEFWGHQIGTKGFRK